MPESVEPFAFYTERRLVVLTGRKACNLEELLCHLTRVSRLFYFLSHALLISCLSL